MKPIQLFLFILLGTLWLGSMRPESALGQTQIEAFPGEADLADPSIRFLTVGDWAPEAELYLRVSLATAEIYDEIYVEQIVIVPDTEGSTRVLNTQYLNGFELANVLELDAGALHDLEFVEWLHWDTFLLREDDIFFTVQMVDTDEFEITRLTPIPSPSVDLAF